MWVCYFFFGKLQILILVDLVQRGCDKKMRRTVRQQMLVILEKECQAMFMNSAPPHTNHIKLQPQAQRGGLQLHNSRTTQEALLLLSTQTVEQHTFDLAHNNWSLIHQCCGAGPFSVGSGSGSGGLAPTMAVVEKVEFRIFLHPGLNAPNTHNFVQQNRAKYC